MSIDKVKNYLKKYSYDDKILEFDKSSATVELAAKAIGCKESEILKTLSFKINDDCIVVCVSGDSRVDNRKYKDLFNVKARMLKHDEVEYYTGHKVGGVCPFALKEGVKIYLDKSLKKHEYVYPACGSFNSAIRLSLSELERITEYPEWIDVCREDNNA